VKAVVQHLSNLIRIPSPSFLSNQPIVNYAVTALRKAPANQEIPAIQQTG
jgi:hypothetical protein